MVDFMVQFGTPLEKNGLVRILYHLAILLLFYDTSLCLRMSTLRVVLSPHFWYELSDYFAAMPSVGKMSVDTSKTVEMISDSYMGTKILASFSSLINQNL
jgi:hypothetical protein